jgi:hypothetical protein
LPKKKKKKKKRNKTFLFDNDELVFKIEISLVAYGIKEMSLQPYMPCERADYTFCTGAPFAVVQKSEYWVILTWPFI